jgi:hypothetical protein
LVTDIYNNTNRTAFKEFYAVLIDLLLQNRSLNEMTQTEKDLIKKLKLKLIAINSKSFFIFAGNTHYILTKP